MINFCTLFDSNYLTRGLAMYASLQRHCADFHLYVVAFDERCLDILNLLRLPKVTLVSLAEFEDEDLLKVKPSRTPGEYCWTCTPHVIRYVLETFHLPQVTYLDADLYFFADPGVLLAELDRSGASVLITEHRYTPRYDQSATSGIYCVQFVTFKADEHGLTALRWWDDRCLEWCYARMEDGKFGDQKYLDDWTTRFEGVHVLEHLGGGVAPWNIQQYRLEDQGGQLSVNGVPVVFYHFHNYRWYADGSHSLGVYRLAGQVVDLLYRPYVRALAEAKRLVQGVNPGFDRGASSRCRNLRSLIWDVINILKGTYNVYRKL